MRDTSKTMSPSLTGSGRRKTRNYELRKYALDWRRLKALRIGQGMTVEELGKKSGVSPHTLHKLEQGYRQQARTNTVQQIASALSVPVNYLVVGAETAEDFDPDELAMAVKYSRLSEEHRKVLNKMADELLRLPQSEEAVA